MTQRTMFYKVMKFGLRKIIFNQNKFQTCRYCATVNLQKDVVTFFQNNFGLSEDDIKKICEKYTSLNKNSSSKLSDNFNTLMEFGFLKEDIIENIQILTFHQVTIKNYIMLLQEGGFCKEKINSRTVVRFKNIFEKSITTLKNEKYIPKHVNVQHNILSFIQFPKELYPTHCDDSLTWELVQKNIFNLYVGWKLNMNFESIKHAQTIYHRLTNKSFRLMEKSINQLLYELHFNKDKIQRNPYLIYSDAENTQAILDNFKYLCGEDPKVILSKHPKILLTSWKTIKKIQQHFEEFGIPENALAKVPEIYTLGSETIYKRLCEIKETPELSSFLNNPQIARLVFYNKKVNLRLKYLQAKNCLSLNLLVTNDSSFNRFNYNGNNKGKTNDIMIYLTDKLHINKNKLRVLLERHPYWQYISLLKIRKTYEFLENNNFTNDQIYYNCHILLYPVKKIEDTLATIQLLKNVSYLRNSSGSIKSEYILPLILYELEKNYHFSGDGVWSIDEQIVSDSLKETFDDTEELDHEPSAKLLI